MNYLDEGVIRPHTQSLIVKAAHDIDAIMHDILDEIADTGHSELESFVHAIELCELVTRLSHVNDTLIKRN